MLVPLALNGLLLFGARRSYAVDVATAIASEDAVSGGEASEDAVSVHEQPSARRRAAKTATG
jgi:hypothetical protein